MYNEICVCVNNVHEHPEAIVAACKFAERFNGSVTAAYIRPDVAEIVRWQGTSPIDLATKMLADVDAREEKAKQAFAVLSKPYEVVKTWRTIPSSEEPHRHMFCCDVIFAAQPTPAHQQYPSNQSFLNNLILQTKRPIVMIPNGWQQDTFGVNVLLGWNSSAEAMRAASDALPILELSASVTVLDILISRLFRKESSSLYYIQDYLTNKKINNQLVVDNCAKSSDVPKQLIKRCKSENIDLVVVGGYGHSRVKEVIMGGMTDYLIKHADVPVFFSH